MTRDTQAIDALIEAVRGGDEVAVEVHSRKIESDARDRGALFPSHDIKKAFLGSMDTALGLLNQLLPGWWAEIRISTRPLARIGSIDAQAEEQDETPARALLLATLKAWRDME